MLQTVYYVSARASAGKTYEATREAHRLALTGGWVLIVQPTRELIERGAA